MNTAEKALTFWGLGEATVILVAARENKVFCVNNDQHCYALRLHRKGYRTNSELLAELDWMAMLDRAGLSVPTPIAGLDGSYLQIVDGVQVGTVVNGTLGHGMVALGSGFHSAYFDNFTVNATQSVMGML